MHLSLAQELGLLNVILRDSPLDQHYIHINVKSSPWGPTEEFSKLWMLQDKPILGKLSHEVRKTVPVKASLGMLSCLLSSLATPLGQKKLV